MAGGAAGSHRMSDAPDEKKIVQHYPPPPDDELPPPTFRQALIGYGSIIAGLVLLGVLIGVLMKFLR